MCLIQLQVRYLNHQPILQLIHAYMCSMVSILQVPHIYRISIYLFQFIQNSMHYYILQRIYQISSTRPYIKCMKRYASHTTYSSYKSYKSADIYNQKYTSHTTYQRMYTDIYIQSYVSHTTYQGMYTDIYMQSQASHTTYQNMYTMQMRMQK